MDKFLDDADDGGEDARPAEEDRPRPSAANMNGRHTAGGAQGSRRLGSGWFAVGRRAFQGSIRGGGGGVRLGSRPLLVLLSREEGRPRWGGR